MSYSDEYTEKELNKLRTKIGREFKRIQKDIEADAEQYFADFERLQAEKLKQVQEGEMSQAEYNLWAKNKMLYGERYEQLEERLARSLVNTQNIAAGYTAGAMVGVFALNNRFQQYQIEKAYGVSYSMYNDDAINRLLLENPEVLPKPSVNIPKAQRWNQKKICQTLTSSIIRGQSVKNLASDLQQVTNMNKSSAVRNARTMITGAQNAGRSEGLKRAKGMGINVMKEWISTHDARTRDSHAELDGEIVPVDERFSNGLMFPGDPQGHPSEVYNCRCTMAGALPDIEEDTGYEKGDYDKWIKEKSGGHVTDDDFKNLSRYDIIQKKIDGEQYEKYKEILGKNSPTFDGFVNIKNSDSWGLFKHYKNAIKSGEVTPLADFKLFEDTYKEAKSRLVGIKAVNDVEIKGITHHLTERIIGSVEKKRNGISIDQIERLLTSEKTLVGDIEERANGKGQRLALGKVAVVINPDKKIIVQCNPWKEGRKP